MLAGFKLIFFSVSYKWQSGSRLVLQPALFNEGYFSMDSVSQSWKTERWLGPQWQQGRANALQILLCQGVANTGLPIQPAESMCCALETEKDPATGIRANSYTWVLCHLQVEKIHKWI